MMKRFSADYFDKDYFCGGKKLAYNSYEPETEEEKNVIYSEEIIKYYKPNTVLDIGCAMGYLMGTLEKRGVRTYGCDISEYAIFHNPHRDRIKRWDIRDGVPFPDEYFDVVCSDSTLEHIDIDYIPLVMRETYRVATRGFYLVIPVSLGMENAPWGDLSHVTYMPPSFWISEAYKSGWSVDLRRTKHISRGAFQTVTFVFYKGTLYSV